MKYTILLFATFLLLRINANAQQRDVYTDVTMERKTNKSPLTTRVAANKILYQIDSVYYDNDSSTALPPPRLSGLKKDSIKKFSSVSGRDGIAAYTSRAIQHPEKYEELIIITTKKGK